MKTSEQGGKWENADSKTEGVQECLTFLMEYLIPEKLKITKNKNKKFIHAQKRKKKNTQNWNNDCC